MNKVGGEDNAERHRPASYQQVKRKDIWKMKTAILFRYKIQFDGDDDMQERFVLAFSTEEADKKMEEYHDYMVTHGFSEFFYHNMGVEIDHVII